MKFLSLIFLQAVFLTACSSLPQSSATSPTPNTTKSSDPVQVTERPAARELPKVREPENLDLRRLDSVATALRAIYDQSLLNPAPRVPSMLACDVSGEEAVAMMMPLKARMDERIPRELKDYIRNPRQYAKDNNFASCQVTCHCGLYAGLVADAVVEAGDEAWHKSQLRSLQRKAASQTTEQTMTCARLQTWFCDSSLRAELMSEVNQ